jgi:hypothetical protein
MVKSNCRERPEMFIKKKSELALLKGMEVRSHPLMAEAYVCHGVGVFQMVQIPHSKFMPKAYN